MKATSLLVIGLIMALMQPGCSVYKAASQPPPADLNGIGIGTSRGELIARLGAPKFSDTDPGGQKQDTFEFDSGFHSASKVRIIPYLAADLFTLGLAELILWPLEMTVMERAKCVGMATYDPTQKVNGWNVSQRDGAQAC
jgi:hypothetical protein